MRRPCPAFPALILCVLPACAAPVAAEKFSDPSAEAKVIVTGQVQSLQSKLVPHPAGGTDNSYTIQFLVAGVERGGTVKPGETITLTCWKAASRSILERAGMSGQHYIPRPGEL